MGRSAVLLPSWLTGSQACLRYLQVCAACSSCKLASLYLFVAQQDCGTPCQALAELIAGHVTGQVLIGSILMPQQSLARSMCGGM